MKGKRYRRKEESERERRGRDEGERVTEGGRANRFFLATVKRGTTTTLESQCAKN